MNSTDYKTAIFIDIIDGTIIDKKTEQPLPNAVETINEWYENGHRIILTTRRGNEWYDSTNRYSEQSTIRLLKSIGLKYHDILFNIDSPRIIINDKGAFGYNHPADESWEKEIQEFPHKCIEQAYFDTK